MKTEMFAKDFILKSIDKIDSDVLFDITPIDIKSVGNLINLKQPDILDKDIEDYLFFKTRALSKSILHGMIDIDITGGDILKNSASMLNDKTLYANHEVDTAKWVGKIVHTEWDDLEDPNGINVIIRVPKPKSKYSTEFNSSIAKGLMDGSLNSFSVGVNWVLRKSHPELNSFEFLMMQSEVINGNRVRYIVDKIDKYRELSVVYDGYDPKAKIKSSIVLKKDSLGNKDDILIGTKEEFIRIITELSANLNNKISLENNDNNNIIKSDNDNNNIKSYKELKNMEVKDNASSNAVKSEVSNIEKQKPITTDVPTSNEEELFDTSKMVRKEEKKDSIESRLEITTKSLSKLIEKYDTQESAIQNLRADINQKDMENKRLNSMLKLKSYNSFKEEIIRDGYVTNTMLLYNPEKGTEELDEFYRSLDDKQLEVFVKFVKSSPLPTLNKLSDISINSKLSKIKKDDNKLYNEREKWVSRRVNELIAESGKSQLDAYADSSVYSRLVDKANVDYDNLGDGI